MWQSQKPSISCVFILKNSSSKNITIVYIGENASEKRILQGDFHQYIISNNNYLAAPESGIPALFLEIQLLQDWVKSNHLLCDWHQNLKRTNSYQG